MRRVAISLLVLVSLLLLPAMGVQAEATKTPVQFEVAFVTVDPGRIWVSDGGILHIRGLQTEDIISGDIVGTGSEVVNANIDSTGSGTNLLTFTIAGTWDGRTGTFEGKAHGTFSLGVGSGKLIGHGTGGFAGLKIMGSWVSVLGSGAVSFDATILNPHS